MTSMAENCSAGRILWVVLTVTFLVTSIALAVVVAYLKITNCGKSNDEKDLILQFPGYFRTPEEQAVVEREYKKDLQRNDSFTQAVPVNESSQLFCQYRCPAQRNQTFTTLAPRSGNQTKAPIIRRRRHADDVTTYMNVLKTFKTHNRRAVRDASKKDYSYHGCCISRPIFIDPEQAKNLAGDRVLKILQLPGNRQYFLSQECRHDRNCTICGCRQEPTAVRAVVENDEYPQSREYRYVVKFITIPGCCKCFNGLPPP